MKTIYFDMDGTIVNFYSVDNWLKKLTIEDSSPYEDALPLLDINRLEDLLLKLKSMGYNLGIITWSSKYSSEKFIHKVKISKENWIKKYFKKIQFDEFVILDYSCNKASSVKDPFGILFDDDFMIRKNWPGKSYPPECIFPVLSELVGEEFNEKF